MTAKMIRYDEEYAPLLEELVGKSDGHIEIVDDQNLAFNPCFYARKTSLDKTIEAVDNGTMRMIDQK